MKSNTNVIEGARHQWAEGGEACGGLSLSVNDEETVI